MLLGMIILKADLHTTSLFSECGISINLFSNRYLPGNTFSFGKWDQATQRSVQSKPYKSKLDWETAMYSRLLKQVL